jgi:DNA-binding transcriptional ArsR family regulator
MDHQQRNSLPSLATGTDQAVLSLPSPTFDAIRSFITLADSQNLSETVRILGVTRQTVRRHINLLEDLRKVELFSLEGGVYHLTDEGKAEYNAVRPLLSRASRWLEGLASISPALELCRYRGPDGTYYYSQEHRISDMMRSGPRPVNRVYSAWIAARGELETPAFNKVRAEVLVYREQFGSWLCVHVGDRSSLSTWLGSVWARSVIGALLEQDPIANPADEFVMRAYKQVMETGNCRYDHAAVIVTRPPEKTAEAVNYHRLLLPCAFPNGEPALMVYTLRTNAIDLGLLGKVDIKQMPPEFEMLTGHQNDRSAS